MARKNQIYKYPFNKTIQEMFCVRCKSFIDGFECSACEIQMSQFDEIKKQNTDSATEEEETNA